MARHRKRLKEPLEYSLTELEEHDWGPPTYSSSLVQSVHRLRDVPLKDLTAGDLRLLIGQQLSLPYLVLRAIDILQTDPFVEGTFFPGDLLKAVLEISTDFWSNYPDLFQGTLQIAKMSAVRNEFDELLKDVRQSIQDFISSASAIP